MFLAEKYLKTLLGIKRVQDAFQRLDKLTQEEAYMAAAENLTIAHRMDENVEGVNEGVQRVDMKVDDIDDRLQRVHANVQGVGNEVGLINTGELFFYALAPESVLSLTRLGVTEATVEIRLVSKQLSDLARS